MKAIVVVNVSIYITLFSILPFIILIDIIKKLTVLKKGGRGKIMNKKCHFYLLSAVCLFSVVSTIYGGATLSLSPATVNVTVNNNFNVKVVLNTGGSDVVAVDCILNFDVSKLEVVNVSANTTTNFKTFVPVKSDGSFDVDRVKQTANSTGKIELGCVTFDWGSESITNPVNGSNVELVTITYKAKATGECDITFVYEGSGKTTDSNVVSISGDNVLDILDNPTQNKAHVVISGTGDTTPPAQVNTLSAEPGPNAGEVTLRWQSVGDDGNTGNLTGYYKIQYLTTDGPWNISNAQITKEVNNVSPGTQLSHVVGSLTGGVTYYFVVWGCDEAGNCATSPSNVAFTYAKPSAPGGDTTPPAQVNTLSAEPGPNAGEVTLRWQSVGDDGNTGNLTGYYKIQYLTTDGPWNISNAQITKEVNNVSPGTQLSHVVGSLTGGVTYYFVVWGCDEAGNCATSPSNVAFTYAKPSAPGGVIIPAPTLLIPGNRSRTTKNRPTFYWNPVSVAGATNITYTLQVDDDIFFASPEIDTGSLTMPNFTSPIELPSGVTYYWHVKAMDDKGNESNWSEVWSFYIVKKEEISAIFTSTELYPPKPNIIKVGGTTLGGKINVRLRYTLKEREEVELKIYTVGGQLVKTIVDKVVESVDTYEKIWDGRDEEGNLVPSGIYIVYLKVGDTVKIEKIIVIR